MHKNFKSIILALILIFVFTVPAFAASSTFLSKAQRYYDSNCNRRNISSETSLQCYVFDKANEIQTSLDSLTSRVTNTENKNADQDALIESLQARIEVLEQTPTPLPESMTGTFSIETPINVTGYGRISVSIQGQQGSAAIYYSDNQTDWQLQGKFGEDFGDKSSYVYPIKGAYYKISSWASPSTYNYLIDNTQVTGPTSDFSFSPQSPTLNQQMTFTNTSVGGTQFKWEFGSPYTSYNTNSVVNLTPNQTGTFIVHLYVQNGDGVVDTKSALITVSD